VLEKLADDVWVEKRPQRLWGLELGCRMTVVRRARPHMESTHGDPFGRDETKASLPKRP
jgi:hypothetical protein